MYVGKKYVANYLLVLFSLVACPLVKAQFCSGTLGAPVFSENFGSGAAVYGPALPSGVTNYPYVTGTPTNDSYVISSSSDPSGTTGAAGDYIVCPSDHTGNANGYMMVINADYTATEVYRKHVSNLCPGTTYIFSAYLSNNDDPSVLTSVCGGNYIYANVQFQAEYPVGVIQGSITTGNLPLSSNHTTLNWQPYGFAFTTGAGQTTADIVMINNAPGGCGNDYVVDDISLTPCGPPVLINMVPNKNIFCTGDTVMMQVTFTAGSYAGPQYQWQYSSSGDVWTNINGATFSAYFINGLTQANSGMYQVLVSENGNINTPSCRIIASAVSFTVNPTPQVHISAGNSNSCSSAVGDTLTASGAVTYNWSTGATTNSVIVNPTATTTYTVTGVAGTCSNVAVETVSANTQPTVLVTGNTVVCAGQPTTLTASGADTYLWSNGTPTNLVVVSPTTTTSYTVVGTTGTCTNAAVETVSVNPDPLISVTGNTVVCIGQTVTLTASGATTFTWSTGATTNFIVVSPTTATSYTVVGALGTCTNVAVENIVTASTSLTGNTVICAGKSTLLTAHGSNTYVWSTGETTASIVVSPPVSTTYTVSGTTGTCITQTVETISVNPAPKAMYAISPNPTTTFSATISFTNESVNYTAWWWNFGDGTAKDSVTVNPAHYYVSELGGTYQTTLLVSNQYGCTDEADIVLEIQPEFAFYLPNTFTPNNDGLNEVFTGEGVGIINYEMQIFDRWGTCIFSSDDINNGWDGKLKNKGNIVQQDVYVWKVEIKDALKKSHQFSGTVTVIK